MAAIAVTTTHRASELSEADTVARVLSDVRLEITSLVDGKTRLQLSVEG